MKTLGQIELENGKFEVSDPVSVNLIVPGVDGALMVDVFADEDAIVYVDREGAEEILKAWENIDEGDERGWLLTNGHDFVFVSYDGSGMTLTEWSESWGDGAYRIGEGPFGDAIEWDER